MDISQVYMVRSAKGNDMLCVDSFLYYYDDRGVTSYRWSCSKRKDKVSPCKSRIITNLIENDETKHAVVKVFGEHSHGQCSPEEISKAFERKRIANLEGKPCTLEAKAEKRKLMRQDDEEFSQSSKNGSLTKTKRSKMESGAGRRVLSSNIKQESLNESLSDNNDTIAATTLEDSNVYMLKTMHGREMVCVDGYLYRLERKALNYHWECSRRRNDGCKARIQTFRMQSGRHAVKLRRFQHTHPPYPRDKLAKLFNKQQLNIPTDDFFEKNKTETETTEFEEINLANNFKLLQEMMSPVIQNTEKNTIKYDIQELETTIDDEQHDVGGDDDGGYDHGGYDHGDDGYDHGDGGDYDHGDGGDYDHDDDGDYDHGDDGNDDHGDDNKKNLLESIPSKQRHASDNKETNVDPLEGNAESIQTDLDLSQISLLPSLKGNKILCIDNFLYHFDSRSSNKQRIYWTCVHRRDKFYNCKARITSDNNINSSIKIMKVSGQHMHPNDVDKVKQRLCNDLVVKAANTSNMKPKEFLNSSINDKIKKSNSDDDNDSMSSLSSSIHSDDNDDFPELPTNLDQMKSINKEVSMLKTTNKKFGITDIPKVTPENKSSKLNKAKAECRQKIKYEEPYEVQLIDASMDQINNEFCEELVSDMDLTKISTLRSAKGGELLCIDDYLYHVKSASDVSTYWECIKSKNKIIKCKSRVTTIMTTHGYVVKKVTNLHTHEASKAEVEKRVMRNARKGFNRPSTSPLAISDLFDWDQPQVLKVEKGSSETNSTTVQVKMRKNSTETRSVMKLYSVSDGPPSLAVQMTLKALKIPYELVNVDYCIGEHMTEEYAKMNPQKEIPVLDDDGFHLSESVAIMQYLCDKYAPHSMLYPKDAVKRAIVNHRLCFNMTFYYSNISAHAMAPIFFDYPRNEMSLMKVNNALAVFEKYLQRSKTKYAAGDYLTIADFPLVTATLCLEAIGFDLSPYSLVKKWYENFKEDNPELWEIGNVGMKEIEKFEKNPPDLSNLNHPFHPARRIKQ